MPARRALAVVAAAAIVVTSACSGGGEPAPTPKKQTAEEAGRIIAERLSAGDLGDFPIKSGDPKTDLEDNIASMGGMRPKVTLDQAMRQGSGATLNLDYEWPLAYPWTYRAKATIVQEEGVWKLVWKPDALHPSLSEETKMERITEPSQRANLLGLSNAVLSTDGGYAKTVAGEISMATQTDAKESKGRVAAGDMMGRNGLQQRFDNELRGGGATKVFLAPRAAKPGVTQPKSDNTLATYPGRPGTSIATTIDTNIQTAAEDTLSTMDAPISLVVVRVNDGAILAAADSRGAKANDSTAGAFHPGSAGGPVTALAALRSGMKTSDKVDCVKDKSTSQVSLESALAQDCDLGGLGSRISGDAYAKAAASLGLGADLDLGFTNKTATVGTAGSDAALSGKDGMTISPLGLAAMTASAVSGRTQAPWATDRLRPKADGQLSGDEAKALQSLLKTGGNRSSASGLTGVLSSEVDGREVFIGHNKDLALAIVIGDAKNTKITPESISSRLLAGAARSGPAKKSSSSSSSDGDD